MYKSQERTLAKVSTPVHPMVTCIKCSLVCHMIWYTAVMGQTEFAIQLKSQYAFNYVTIGLNSNETGI